MQQHIIPHLLNIAIDTEYCGHFFLTVQLYFAELNLRVLVINNDLYNTHPTLKSRIRNLKKEYLDANVCDKVFYLNLSNDKSKNLKYLVESIFAEQKLAFPKKIRIFLFFAINDLYPLFGFENCITPLLRGHTKFRHHEFLDRKKNVKGLLKVTINEETINCSICDVSGLSSSKSSLKNFADTCGISMPDKESLNLYKEDMRAAMLHDDQSIRLLFGRYGMQDAMVLDSLHKKTFSNINLLLTECFGFSNEFLFGYETFPSTIGKIIAICFENHIYNYVSKKTNLKAFKWAVAKHGYLDSKSKTNYKNSLEERKKLLNDDRYYLSVSETHYSPYVYSSDLLNIASIPSILQGIDLNSKTKIYTSASVTGGRCINERYRETCLKNVFDVDFVSCYGSSLTSLLFPIGKPSVYAASVNERGISLGLFLKKHKSQLVDRTWKIVVTGALSFHQDLIYSKIESSTALSQYLRLKKNPINPLREHVLVREEIVNGVITSDLLEIIEKVSTSQEIKEWYKLEVTSAIWYSKKDFIFEIDEWTKQSLETKANKFKKWTSIPISSFIDPLLDKRLDLKKKLKDKNTSLEAKKVFKAQDVHVKLMINTLYGVLASVYFRIGNSPVAENITARPRADIWKMQKVLNGAQSITDGSTYQPSNINALKIGKNYKKPGFDSFSDYYKLKKHRSIQETSLDNKDWNQTFGSKAILSIDYQYLDKKVEDVINEFWASYDLIGTTFKMEHKPEKTSYSMGYWGKANYFLETVDGDNIVKARGHETPAPEDLNSFSDITNNLENPEDLELFQEEKDLKNIPNTIWLCILNFKKNYLPKLLYYQKNVLVTPLEWRRSYKQDSETKVRPGLLKQT